MAHLLFQQQTFDHIDLIIHSGHVIDPANNINGLFDVIIVDTRVVGVVVKTTSEQRSLSKELHDATGCFVTPGLIDLHAHVYQHSTPLGIDPDTHCLWCHDSCRCRKLGCDYVCWPARVHCQKIHNTSPLFHSHLHAWLGICWLQWIWDGW